MIVQLPIRVAENKEEAHLFGRPIAKLAAMQEDAAAAAAAADAELPPDTAVQDPLI